MKSTLQQALDEITVQEIKDMRGDELQRLVESLYCYFTIAEDLNNERKTKIKDESPF
jgi:hypothetical protein